jgi:hypothetical protein
VTVLTQLQVWNLNALQKDGSDYPKIANFMKKAEELETYDML